MKLLTKDILKITVFSVIWLFLYSITNENCFECLIGVKNTLISTLSIKNDELFKYHEVVKILPFVGFISLCYYAGITICYKILFINDCEKEYDELITELKQEEKKLTGKYS